MSDDRDMSQRIEDLWSDITELERAAKQAEQAASNAVSAFEELKGSSAEDHEGLVIDVLEELKNTERALEECDPSEPIREIAEIRKEIEEL